MLEKRTTGVLERCLWKFRLRRYVFLRVLLAVCELTYSMMCWIHGLQNTRDGPASTKYSGRPCVNGGRGEDEDAVGDAAVGALAGGSGAGDGARFGDAAGAAGRQGELARCCSSRLPLSSGLDWTTSCSTGFD
ncbi:hypothetical protein EJB05_50450 [Eragrostis curvula]|uniref:Uncharacterized protein n=1 Tax=Eragrostis curvula TaxID=38414 RepID=A0A5J9SY60_9POAL|nr:hypothetical protein EJB05_50450 [Eragrostis curvula]